jgi:hypothetical protein
MKAQPHHPPPPGRSGGHHAAQSLSANLPGDAAPELYYRFGPGERDLRHENVELELDWICRSRMAYAGYTALLPAAVALDIATFPVQLLGVILAGH